MTVLETRGASPARVCWAVFLAVAAGAGACGREADPPVWTELARGFEPRPLTEQVAAWESAAGTPTGNTVTPNARGVELGHVLAPTDWRREEPGTFSAALPSGAFRAAGLPPLLVAPGAEYPRAGADRELAVGETRVAEGRLHLRIPVVARRPPPTLLRLQRAGSAASEELALQPPLWRKGDGAGVFWIQLPAQVVLDEPHAPVLLAQLARVDEERALAPFEYRIAGERLVLRLPLDQPPAEARLVARLGIGHAADGTWRLRLGGCAGAGIPVWSGGSEERACALPPESVLRFTFVHSSPPDGPGVTTRVRLDGTVLFEEAHAAGTGRAPSHAVVPLPPEGRASARLAFEVEGPPGLGGFFAPVIGPAALGTAQQRPWPARPDVVLFLADTFRADALALHGGAPELAPALNRFAERALRFPRARSNAAWTLPSIATLLTGLHPGQHGATDEDLVLPAAAATLPELLARAGYRTGAITDGSFFSPTFGLDQGFEWFSQHDPADWDLDRTLAETRAFLERDDGRPAFLVVHTYRVHQPYRTGPDEDPAAYEALMEAARLDAGTDSPRPAQGHAVLMQHRAGLRALYDEGVRDLDAGFGAFVDWLDGRRFFEHGALLFTSDHGEALGENEEFFHSGHLWEVKLRVPLLLRGAGIAPRAVPHAATLLDVAPTLAELAGLEPDPAWGGASLLALDRDRAALAFQLVRRSRQTALLEGDRKVILTPTDERLDAGTCEEAYDLGADPREEQNLAGKADWAAELTRRLAPAVRGALAPLAPAEQAGVTNELRKQLDDIGYGGGK